MVSVESLLTFVRGWLHQYKEEINSQYFWKLFIFFSVFFLRFDDFSEGVCLRLFRSAACLRPPPPAPPQNPIRPQLSRARPRSGATEILGGCGGGGRQILTPLRITAFSLQLRKISVHFFATGSTVPPEKKKQFFRAKIKLFCLFFSSKTREKVEKNKHFFRVEIKFFCLLQI